MKKVYDWLVVGAGFSGAVLAERIATQMDERVLVIDRRPHLAGNAHDHLDAAGIRVHDYGPHLFHTNSQRVWDYLSNFTQWRPYAHRVRALVDNQLVPVPFNLTSLDLLFSPGQAARMHTSLRRRYGAEAEVPILKMQQERDGDLRGLADYIYNNIFLGYTTKQWGLRPEELSASVTARVPVRVSRDDRYFRDKYQAMPAGGYTAMFERMLSHKNIEVELGLDYRDLPGSISFKRMAYTGPIDAFFDHMHGKLPYRSLRFEFQTLNQPRAQDVAQLNFPNDHPYTRTVEFSHMTGHCGRQTTISREFPQAHEPGVTEPFYPIPREENRAVFEQYRQEARKLGSSVVFCGRLADYQYYNMDQVVARALVVFEQEIAANATRVRSAGDVQPRVAAA